jgi:hypothetical protein
METQTLESTPAGDVRDLAALLAFVRTRCLERVSPGGSMSPDTQESLDRLDAMDHYWLEVPGRARTNLAGTSCAPLPPLCSTATTPARAGRSNSERARRSV